MVLISHPTTWNGVLLLILTSSAWREWYAHTDKHALVPSFPPPVGEQKKICVSPVLGRKVLFWAPSRTNSLLVILRSEDNVRLCRVPYRSLDLISQGIEYPCFSNLINAR